MSNEEKIITDRAGDRWVVQNYMSPSGPAFSILVPDRVSGGGVVNQSIHFDGRIDLEVSGLDRGEPCYCTDGPNWPRHTTARCGRSEPVAASPLSEEKGEPNG